jgi:trans-2,3-dihydro-3-hydroxyanthranilate isomerase
MSLRDMKEPEVTPRARVDTAASVERRNVGLELDHQAFLYESFAAQPFGGNVAGVVLLDQPRPNHWLQGIAAALGAPTTGFVDLPSAALHAARVRFFTPRQEIAACGHVTVAIATALVDEDVWPGAGAASVQTQGGEVELTLATHRHGLTTVTMVQRQRLLERIAGSVALEPLLGKARRHEDLPLALAGTGLRHLFVPVVDEQDLLRLRLDEPEIVRIAEKVGADTIAIYTIVGAAQDPVEVRVRDLCAPIGALEEPASGTTSAGLAFVLADQEVLTPSRRRLEVTMGGEMGRPSRVQVELEFGKGGQATQARVSGTARRVLAGRLASDDLGGRG